MLVTKSWRRKEKNPTDNKEDSNEQPMDGAGCSHPAQQARGEAGEAARQPAAHPWAAFNTGCTRQQSKARTQPTKPSVKLLPGCKRARVATAAD